MHGTGDTRTIIDHIDLNVLATSFFMRGPDVNGQVAAGYFHRFDCIADQVAEDLLQGAQITLVEIQGHADERGSREYNIGLGERRSQAVRQMLLIQGVPASQISTVSFGEERPVALGSDEESWAQNRRVELKYTN